VGIRALTHLLDFRSHPQVRRLVVGWNRPVPVLDRQVNFGHHLELRDDLEQQRAVEPVAERRGRNDVMTALCIVS
jgi:hypothetical protein